MADTPLSAPLLLEGDGASPVILSIPHSGREVSASLAGRAAGGRDALLALSDPHVDTLAASLIEAGHAAVIARTPRAAIDPNRRLDELDPMVSDCAPPPPGSKAAMGIGLVPSRGRGRQLLWKARPGTAEVERRIAQAWRPYHEALSTMIARTLARHGEAILLDLHSMPPPRRGEARIVLGDRHGVTAAPWVLAALERAALDRDEPAIRNHPYAGGAIVASHGRPADGVHAVQIELDRSLYLDTRLSAPGPGMTRTTALLGAMVAALAAPAARIAAE